MTKLTIPETAQWLKSRDHYGIITHRRPDGDTLGSAAALCLGLRRLGKQAWVLKNHEVTPRFSWLCENLWTEDVPDGTTLVTTDVASPGMLPREAEGLRERIGLRIDHHGSATDFTSCSLVEPDSASCAELVWEVLRALECPLDKEIAQAIYVGVSTDTGCFRFANTTDHTFLAAADCARAGAEIYRLNQQLFETNTLERLKIQSWIVDNLRLFRDGMLAICAIPRAVEEAIGVTEDDMDNISNFPRTISGVKMAATLRETAGGEVKLSVRAVPGCDATRVAEAFDGGGHKGAAGASFHCSLEEAAERVRKVMEETAL